MCTFTRRNTMASRKKLFVVLFGENPSLNDLLGRTAARYGIETYGCAWKEEPGKPVWGDIASLTVKNACDGLLVAGDAALWGVPETRAHLSLALLKIRAVLGDGFPVFHRLSPTPGHWPSPLANAVELPGDAFGPRLLGKLAAPPAKTKPDFRLDAHPLGVGDGAVVEIGPEGDGVWQGAILAMRGGGHITHHTVGPRGTLPEKGVVEYAMKGIELEGGNGKYTGWAVQNRLTAAESYFVRIVGEVEGLLFGELPKEDATDLRAVTL